MVGGIQSRPVLLPAEQAQPAQEAEVAVSDTAADDTADMGDPVDQRIAGQVDEVISPSASPEQRDQAITETRAYYDRISAGGDFEGIDDASLQLNTIRTLNDAGIPTIYQSDVVTAVDGVISDYDRYVGGVHLQGATPEQHLEALQLVQEYVNGVGGVSGAGISPQALPGRVDSVLQEAGIPTEASTAAAYVEDALEGFDGMSDEDRITALNEAVERLESRVAGLEPDEAAIVLNSALAPIEAVDDDMRAGGVMLDAQLSPLRERLAGISDHISDARGADGLVERLAEVVIETSGGPGNPSVFSALRESGKGLGMYLQMADMVARSSDYPDGAEGIFMRDLQGALDVFEGNMQSSVDAYLEHTAELSTLVQNLGPAMTPEQLQAAIDDYIAEQGPEWEQEMESLQSAMAEDGAALLEQMEAVDDLPSSLQSWRDDLEGRIAGLADNDHATAAIVAAAGDPALVGELDLPGTIDFLDTLTIGSKGAGLLQQLANAHVQHSVLPEIGEFDPNDPASAAAVRTQLSELRSASFANAWGIDQAQLDDAIDALENAMPRPGDAQADIQLRLSTYNDSLGDIASFGAQTPLGQAFRGLGLALGVVGAGASIKGFIDDPNLGNAVQVLADSAGVISDVGELANGLGWLPDSNPLSKFAANSAVGKLLGSVGIGFGLIGVMDDLSQGDLLQAGIGAAGLGGSALALFGSASWAGPVGVAIGVAATVAGLIIDHVRSGAAEDSLEAAGERFLEQAGFDEQAARILSDFSKDHYSSVGMIMRYGELKGLSPEETVTWVNGIEDMELEYLREVLNHTIDDLDGDYGAFPGTTAPEATYSDTTYRELAEQNRLGVLVPGHLNPESVTQLEIAMEILEIAPPA